MNVFISIATYNEKDNIEKLIQEIFSLGITTLSVIIVDDNSPDKTSEVIKNLQKEFNNIYLIQRNKKLGYGSAHVLAFKEAINKGADLIISMDADFSHQPKEIVNFIKAVEDGYEIIIGSRKINNGKIIGWSKWRYFCSAGAMNLARFVLGIKTHDLTSGFRAYKHKVFETVNLDKINSDGYSFLEEIIYLMEKNNFKIKEIPITFYDRQLGKSKLSKREIIKFFITIFKIKFKKHR